MTKCGVGLITFIRYCSQTGMLSMGVVVPDSSMSTNMTGISEQTELAHGRRHGARIPSAATVKT